ncbi:MAG: 3-dehydroquinate synthase [Gemmatimonadota bacterium]
MPHPIDVTVPGTDERRYEVVIGRGTLSGLGDRVTAAAPAHRYALIADSRVAELHAEAALATLTAAGCDAELFVFPAGEWNKSRAAWAVLSDELLDCGFGRDSAIVALGGGVAGDLSGFVASTYMRGIPFVVVPTSLLAMVDASVGGKTGLDTDRAKNVIGAFHHPRLVLIDPDLLATLPKPHLHAGLAEAVKTAAIRDADRFDWIEAHSEALAAGDPDALTELIIACVRIKAAVVSSDPTEQGLRQILNFGHTAGHALEALAGLALLHGEAVAAGMRIEARLGEAIGVTEPGTAMRLDTTLDACGVPNLLDGSVSAGRLLEAAESDKKNRAGSPRWVLMRRIGEVATDDGGSHSFAIDGGVALEHLTVALRTAAEHADS